MMRLIACLILFSAFPAWAAEPTLSAVQASSFSDITNTGSEATPSITWSAGDIVLVIGLTEDDGVTLNTPTATGLSFSLVTSAGGASDTNAYLWSATAGAGGSSVITANTSGAGGGHNYGLAAFAFTGSDGIGTPATIANSAAKTISLTRVQANAHVLVALADWNAVNDTTVDATPTGTMRVNAFGTNGTYFIASFGDQGATGTTSYGITNHTGTVDMTGIAVEIKGTAGGGAAETFGFRKRLPQ